MSDIPAFRLRTPASEAEEAELASVMAGSFGFAVEEAEPWFDMAGRENLRVWANGVAATSAEDVLGGLISVPMGQYFGGRSVPMLGLAGVALRLERRRQGHASRMLVALLREGRDRGFALSTLYASTVELYRSLGYEQAGSRFKGTIRADRLAASIPLGAGEGMAVRRLDAADAPAMEQLYADCAASMDGHLDRGSYVWGRIRKKRKERVAYLYGAVDAHGKLTGYVAFRHAPDFPDYRIIVLDFIAADLDSAWRLWRVLADQASVASTVHLCSAPAHWLKLMLPNEALKLTLANNWMVRLLDVGRAFETRGFSPAHEAELPIELVDPLIPENDGRFMLRLAGGQAGWDRGGPGTVQTSVQSLAAMYTGFVSVSMAERLGWIEGPRWALKLLETILAGPAPWMPDMF